MKITFLYPSWTGEFGLFGHFAKRNATWPPLNLALLAAIARQSGWDAEIIDAEALGLDKYHLAQRAVQSRADVIGLSAYSPFYHLSCDVAREIKSIKPAQCIIGGGPHFTIMKEKAFTEEFDFAFIGEAEESLPMWLGYYEQARWFWNDVPGLLYRDQGVVRQSSVETRWVSDETKKGSELGRYPLDRFPQPARDLLPMRRYKLGTKDGRRHFSSIQTMRGCPWTCIFCASDALKTTRVVMRSPASVVREMQDTVKLYGVDHFYIVDDVLTLWPQHITEICDLIDQFGLKITFEGSTRANMVTDALMKRMAKSGLVRLCFGLETVDPEMRETMEKKVPLSAYVTANAICNRHGVEATNSCMIGLPGESRKTVEMLFSFLESARDVLQANFAVAVPYPGTKFHEWAAQGTHGVGLLGKDFSEYLRYGHAVSKTDQASAQQLIEWQNEGFVRFYSKPFRWPAMFRKHGVIGFVLMLWRVAKLARRKVAQPFATHPGVP